VLDTVLFSSLVNSLRTDLAEDREQREREDGGGDRHPEAPADLDADVEVRHRHDAAEEHAGGDGARGELRGVRLVDVAQPVFVDPVLLVPRVRPHLCHETRNCARLP
jgi:hypothetical protein